MQLFWLFFFCFISNNLASHIYLDNCADRVGVANLNTISKSPLTSYYQSAVGNDGISTSISQPFQFSGIENGSISISKTYSRINFSLGSVYLLSNHYSQFSNYIALNYTFKEIVTIGVGQKLISVNEEDNYSYPVTDIACLISHDKTKLAVSYTNIFQTESYKIELPNIITTELSYNPIANTFIAVGFEKEKGYKLASKFGTRYKVLQSLTLLSGYSLELNQISFGLGVDYQEFSIHYAVKTHPELDSTHHISLIYEL